MTYRAPLDDYRFLLDSFVPSLVGAPRWTDDGDVVEALARFAEAELAPLNRLGDEAGCRLEGGAVHTPDGFAAAYARFRDGGWPAIGAGEVGAGALFCMDEILGGANLAFSNYVGPTKRVLQTLEAFGDDALKGAYLEPLRAGRIGGTLCLTEPQCGTDLGLVSTRATPVEDGYRINGAKIFVTSGAHDLTDNTLHLVLARLDGAPAGPRGLSLFAVPAFTPEGARNGVVCTGIEHKMGIRASATCSLSFESAHGVLVGAPGAGLKAIFPAMESERLVIALQSLGLAEHALQKARDYALGRLQGRAVSGPRYPDRPADPIIVHADVRRMLLTMRANVEGARALLAWTAAHLDRAGDDLDSRDFVLLMTPMLKAFVTELGVETTNLGVQVFGGHGYIRESGVEQLVRDARVTPLYAGANGIQALDLILRKLPMREGRMLALFTGAVREATDDVAVEAALTKLERATAFLAESKDPNLAGAVGLDYLHLFGHVALTFAWSHAAALNAGKVAVADFYRQRMAPEIDRRLASILAGSATVMAPADEAI
jgi:alkylation response protein AidB-like acyl-CoA dehydrogenase